MSHAHSSTWICSCGWAGKPLIAEDEKREDGVLITTYIATCPECGKRAKEVK